MRRSVRDSAGRGPAPRAEGRGPDPVRLAAFGILLRSMAKRDSIDGPLRAAAATFEDRDRRLLWMLTQETIRWQARLDAVIDPLLHRPIARLDPPIRVLLRLAACQVCVLDQIPGHAIVDEGVRLARRLAAAGAEKLVNAVSRRLVADGKARWAHLEGRTDPADWPIVHSHPAWLVERWRHRWGEETTLSILRWNNERAPVWLRSRPAGPVPAGEPGWVPGTYRMAEGYRPSEDPGFRDGEWTAQDPSETLVGLLAPETAGTILDLCAAPGTKSAHLAARFPTARVAALDRTNPRVRRLRETLERTKEAAGVVLGDARSAPFRPSSAEGVLVDAPCSALGVLRRRIDARWNVRRSDLTRHGRRQSEILAAASVFVRSGGWLLYSVCSTEREETDEVTRGFLTLHFDFRPAPFPFPLPADLLVEEGVLRVLPGRRDCDGVYARLFRRHGETRS